MVYFLLGFLIYFSALALSTNCKFGVFLHLFIKPSNSLAASVLLHLGPTSNLLHIITPAWPVWRWVGHCVGRLFFGWPHCPLGDGQRCPDLHKVTGRDPQTHCETMCCCTFVYIQSWPEQRARRHIHSGSHPQNESYSLTSVLALLQQTRNLELVRAEWGEAMSSKYTILIGSAEAFLLDLTGWFWPGVVLVQMAAGLQEGGQGTWLFSQIICLRF